MANKQDLLNALTVDEVPTYIPNAPFRIHSLTSYVATNETDNDRTRLAGTPRPHLANIALLSTHGGRPARRHGMAS